MSICFLTLRVFQDVKLWIVLYEGARRLEGSPSVEKLRSLYSGDCVMPNLSLNLLIVAHDAIAETVGCHAENVNIFLIFPRF